MYSNTLSHYGVKGMKWGIRKDSKQTQIRARSGRLNSFGKDGHNILYIVGISGSGKSTLTINLANKLMQNQFIWIGTMMEDPNRKHHSLNF